MYPFNVSYTQFILLSVSVTFSTVTTETYLRYHNSQCV